MTVTDNFKCEHCDQQVPINEYIGTKNRNHCPLCLWSRHVDDQQAGDRAAACLGLMKPVGLTFKQAGQNKYGHDRLGELMLIHVCIKCGKVSINRLAADDDNTKILDLLDSEMSIDQWQTIEKSDIKIIDKSQSEEVRAQLFGKG